MLRARSTPSRFSPLAKLSVVLLAIMVLGGAAVFPPPARLAAPVDGAAQAQLLLPEEASPFDKLSPRRVASGDRAASPPTHVAPRETALSLSLPHVDPNPSGTLTSVPVPTVPTPARTPQERVDLPILMYHHVGELPPNADAIRRDLTVSPEAFAAQMRFLRERGYQAVSLDDLLAAFAGEKALAPKAVIVTLDDGYRDNYENAYPILRRYGFVGTIFVVTNLVGLPEYLTWEQIREMAAGGMALEAHGKTHVDFTTLTEGQIVSQLRESKQALERQTGRPVRFFAYPSGRYDARVLRLLLQEGYQAAMIVSYGRVHEAARPFELQRLRIRGSDTLETFVAKLGEVLR